MAVAVLRGPATGKGRHETEFPGHHLEGPRDPEISCWRFSTAPRGLQHLRVVQNHQLDPGGASRTNCAQLRDRHGRRVVNQDLRVRHLAGGHDQLAVVGFAELPLAQAVGVDPGVYAEQVLGDLRPAHLHAEDQDGQALLHGDVLDDVQGEGGLPDRGPPRDDDQLVVLQAVQELVQLVIAGRKPRQAAAAGLGLLDLREHLLQDILDRGGPSPRRFCEISNLQPARSGALRRLGIAATRIAWAVCWSRRRSTSPTMRGPGARRRATLGQRHQRPTPPASPSGRAVY